FRYTEDELKLDIANVRFLRALAYFYLVRIWGDVPLITQITEGVFENTKRAKPDEVLGFATQELLTLVNDLPWQYNGEFPEQQGQFWEQNGQFWQGIAVTKGAAYDLLAHISAWQNDYLNVAKYTKMIMDNKSNEGYDFSSTEELTSSTDGVFAGKANDLIFFLPFNSDYQESSETGHIENWTLVTPYINRQEPEIYIPN